MLIPMATQNLASAYTEEIRDELSYLGTWLPDDQMQLGDMGVLVGQRFVRSSTLTAELGLDVGGTRELAQGDLKYHSRDAVTVSFKAQGVAPDPGLGLAQADAGVVVRFSRANAVLLEMRGRRVVSVEDQLTLGRGILRAWADGKWDPEWCVVVEAVSGDATTVLVAAEADACFELRASGQISAVDVSLVEAGAGFQRVGSQKVGIDVVGKAEATPLLKALRLKKHFWTRDPKVVEAGLEALPPGDPFGQSDVDEAPFDLLGED
jgi:hypothetical protein